MNRYNTTGMLMTWAAKCRRLATHRRVVVVFLKKVFSLMVKNSLQTVKVMVQVSFTERIVRSEVNPINVEKGEHHEKKRHAPGCKSSHQKQQHHEYKIYDLIKDAGRTGN